MVRLLSPLSNSSSLRHDPDPGAEDPAAAVPGGPGGLRGVERGLLPGRSVVRLVHGPRHGVGGRLAPRLRVRLHGPSASIFIRYYDGA